MSNEQSRYFIGPRQPETEKIEQRQEEKIFNLKIFIDKLDADTIKILKREGYYGEPTKENWDKYVEVIQYFLDIEDEDIEKDSNGKISSLLRFINTIENKRSESENEKLKEEDIEELVKELPSWYKI